MQNNVTLIKLAKKHSKLAKKYQEGELVTAIEEAEPGITETEAEAVAELIEVVTTEIAAATPDAGDDNPEPTENVDEVIEMPEDGICPEGFMPSEDGMTCIKPVTDDSPDPIENPDVLPLEEDGTCIEGYRPTEDGTACVLEDLTPEAENILVTLNANSKFKELSPEGRKMHVLAAFKRAHLTPCGCGYLNGYENKKRRKKSNYSLPVKGKLNHVFEWAVPMELSKQSFEEMMLVKFVAMTSGEAKRGENMTDENVTFGAGAMSAAAMFGLAVCDIDHFEEKLPQEYVDKYGEAINDPYPVSIILDAAAAKYIDEEGVERTAVEGYAACVNPLVYSMIKKGKFVGCSVVDYYRKENCACGEDGSNCSCQIDGSHFLTNTFVLEGVPNANGTWVMPVTEEDIGTIITLPDENKLKNVKKHLAHNPLMKGKMEYLKLARKNYMNTIMDSYIDEEGQWMEGKAGIVKFLVDEKSIGEAKAHEMADYLMKHPNALSQEQFEFMSAEDMVAWFDHILEKNIKNMRMHMAKAIKNLATRNHADMLGKDSVNYRASDGNESCGGCRWFTPNMDFETGEPTEFGWCNLVVGDINAADTCDRHESLAQTSAAAEGGEGTGGEPEPELAENTLGLKTLNKYKKTASKHSTVQIEKRPEKTMTQRRKSHARTKEAIENLKKEPVFFAAQGAKRHGIIKSSIKELEKKTKQ